MRKFAARLDPRLLSKSVRAFFAEPRVYWHTQVGLAMALGATLLLSVILFLGLLDPLEPRVADFLYQGRTPSGQVVLIAIDDASLQALGPWPWQRSVHTAFLQALAALQPRVIAFDLLFTQPSPDDAALSAAIKSAGNVIEPVMGLEAAAFPLRHGQYPEFDVVLAPLDVSARDVAHAMTMPDSDRIVRRMPLAIQASGQFYPAMGLVAASRFLNQPLASLAIQNHTVNFGSIPIPVDDYGRLLINYVGPPSALPTLSYADVLQGRVPADKVRDKLVFVGVTHSINPERYATPLTRGDADTYPVQIQADLAEMFVGSKPYLLTPQDRLGQIATILFLSLLAGLTLPHIRPSTATGLVIVYILAYLIYAFDAFNNGLVLNLLYPLAGLALTYAGVVTYRYVSEERRRQSLNRLFRRYLPNNLVRQVLADYDRGVLPLGGTRREVTILYADLRGFATLSDSVAPGAVLDLVNDTLTIFIQAIYAQGGTVYKPLGDSLVAVWNAPLNQPDHAQRAVRASLEMRRQFRESRKEPVEEGELSFGVGLTTGIAVVGNVSPAGRSEYTLVGDAVNTAARISAFAGPTQILVDSGTYARVQKDFELREMQAVRIRGKKEPVALWEVRDPAEVRLGG
jgi:adenylate cyclase